MAETKIDWADVVWNPLAGCSRASEGCRYCYAETMAARLERMGLPLYAGLTRQTADGPRWTGKVNLADDRKLWEPTYRKKPTRYFVNSMSDLFHEAVPFGFVMRVFHVVFQSPQHTFLVLTKRPKRARAFMTQWGDLSGEGFEPKLARGPQATRAAHPSGRGQLFADMLEAMGEPPPGCAYPTFDWMDGMIGWPAYPSNLWLGVSVENQAAADERIPELLATPAARRFVSYEPALGAVDWKRWLPTRQPAMSPDGTPFLAPHFFQTRCEHCGWVGSSELCGEINYGDDVDVTCPECQEHGVFDELPEIEWVICGGQSGRDARPMHPDWARGLRDQCAAAGVPFFFKQWGEWLPWPHFGLAGIDDAAESTRYRTMEWTDDGWEDVGYPIWSDWVDGVIDDEQCVGRVGKKAAGHLLDGREHREVPHG